MDTNWSKEELEKAFRTHEAAIATGVSTQNWEPFVQLFVPDAEYIDPIAGTMRGRDEIRAWFNAQLATFPGSAMHFPVAWHMVDEEQGRIVCEIRNVMRDPGDGSVQEDSNITILRYAGDGLFLSEQDVYDPGSMTGMMSRWAERAVELGTLTESEIAKLGSSMPGTPDGLLGPA